MYINGNYLQIPNGKGKLTKWKLRKDPFHIGMIYVKGVTNGHYKDNKFTRFLQDDCQSNGILFWINKEKYFHRHI